MTTWHASNPWHERATYVPIEELAEALAGDFTTIGDKRVAMDAAFYIEMWTGHGGPVDCYILPGQPLGHSVGVRYGSEGSEYSSMHVHRANRGKVAELFQRHQAPSAPSAEPRP